MLEHGELLQQNESLAPRTALQRGVAAVGLCERFLVVRGPARKVVGGEQAAVRRTGAIHQRVRAVEAAHGFGDEAAIPRSARRLDLTLAIGACGFGVAEYAAIGRRERAIAEELRWLRDAAAGQINRGGARPVLAEERCDRDERLDDARHERVAVLGVAERRLEHVAQAERSVVAEEEHPRVERARHSRRQEPRAGDELETKRREGLDRRPCRRHALAAERSGALLLLAPEQDRHFAARAVEMRLHHLQRERGGDGGVEGVAAAFEHPHRGRRCEPVGRGGHAERAADLRTGSEGRCAHGAGASAARAASASACGTSASE